MKFTDLFIKRPVLAIVVSLVILIAGLQAIRSLSVRQYPRSDIAVVQVSTVYVGANADLVRGFITTPIERVIASADGIDYMESSSAQGLSTIATESMQSHNCLVNRLLEGILRQETFGMANRGVVIAPLLAKSNQACQDARVLLLQALAMGFDPFVIQAG